MAVEDSWAIEFKTKIGNVLQWPSNLILTFSNSYNQSLEICRAYIAFPSRLVSHPLLLRLSALFLFFPSLIRLTFTVFSF